MWMCILRKPGLCIRGQMIFECSGWTSSPSLFLILIIIQQSAFCPKTVLSSWKRTISRSGSKRAISGYRKNSPTTREVTREVLGGKCYFGGRKCLKELSFKIFSPSSERALPFGSSFKKKVSPAFNPCYRLFLCVLSFLAFLPLAPPFLHPVFWDTCTGWIPRADCGLLQTTSHSA